jgi:hypothetical protein
LRKLKIREADGQDEGDGGVGEDEEDCFSNLPILLIFPTFLSF